MVLLEIAMLNAPIIPNLPSRFPAFSVSGPEQGASKEMPPLTIPPAN